jgi:hypothetical protein
MKPRLTIAILLCSSSLAFAEEWVVWKQAGTNACRTQTKTSSVDGGKLLTLGPFSTKAQANAAMCNYRDSEITDTNKCWVTIPDNACPASPAKKEEKKQ